MEKVINDLVGYENLKIVQCNDYFNFSLESVLLPNFAIIGPKYEKIMDFCTGNAPIPMIMSTKTNAQIVGVEIQKEIYDLAIESVNMNKLDNQILIINDDIKNMHNSYSTDSFDLITCNPPYFKVNEDTLRNNNKIKSNARHENLVKLEDIIKESKILLKNNASLTLVHRTDRLIEIIELMQKHNMEPKRLRFIYPKEKCESNMIMLDCRKNGKPGLKVLPPLYVHKENGEYTEEVMQMFS